jgi:hypothetical protein
MLRHVCREEQCAERGVEKRDQRHLRISHPESRFSTRHRIEAGEPSVCASGEREWQIYCW